MTSPKTNLSDLNLSDEADHGSKMSVLHPVNRTPLIAADGEPVTLTLVGTESDIYINTVNKNRDDNIEELRRRAKFSSAADDYKGAKLLAKCTLGWHGIPKGWLDGSKDEDVAEFSYDNAVMLYNNRGVRWLREQADEYIADRSNFLKASSKT